MTTLLFAALGCDSTKDPSDPPADVSWPTLACDALVPSYCMFPWPNNVFTRPDAASPTGLRLALDNARTPRSYVEEQNDLSRWNALDGFSRGAPLLTEFPGATSAGLPTADNIAHSLDDDSPTVLLNAETGERVLHLAELDHSAANLNAHTLLITPGLSLEPGTRYIVAIRNLQGQDGIALAPSSAFAALRDGTPSKNADLDARRPLYTDIFARLEQAGVARETLQLAWDFTTNSREATSRDMLQMRDEALASPALAYTIEEEDLAFDDNVDVHLLGTITMPTYLEGPNWPSGLARDSDKKPVQQGTLDVPFAAIIPKSAAQTPAPLLQYGHGLLGEKEQAVSPHFRTFSNAYNYVVFGLDWTGMASDDEPWIAVSLNKGLYSNIGTMMDRLHEGTMRQLVGMRVMSTLMSNDASWGSRIDPSQRYYLGISQGGILGGVYMTLSTDVTRGVLGVPGQPYNLLLTRSVDFDQFFTIVRGVWDDARDVHMVLNLIQHVWDPVDPTAYTPFLRDNTLPGTPPHNVLLRGAIGDHQVTTLGAHVMARSVGAVHLDTGLRKVAGLEQATGPVQGSAYVEYDFGLPPEPVCNIPMRACDDPHGKIRGLAQAQQQLDVFLRTGEVKNLCDGPCSFPEMSGCDDSDLVEDACAN